MSREEIVLPEGSTKPFGKVLGDAVPAAPVAQPAAHSPADEHVVVLRALRPISFGGPRDDGFPNALQRGQCMHLARPSIQTHWRAVNAGHAEFVFAQPEELKSAIPAEHGADAFAPTSLDEIRHQAVCKWNDDAIMRRANYLLLKANGKKPAKHDDWLEAAIAEEQERRDAPRQQRWKEDGELLLKALAEPDARAEREFQEAAAAFERKKQMRAAELANPRAPGVAAAGLLIELAGDDDERSEAQRQLEEAKRRELKVNLGRRLESLKGTVEGREHNSPHVDGTAARDLVTRAEAAFDADDLSTCGLLCNELHSELQPKGTPNPGKGYGTFNVAF